jgi:hypothetical protein
MMFLNPLDLIVVLLDFLNINKKCFTKIVGLDCFQKLASMSKISTKCVAHEIGSKLTFLRKTYLQTPHSPKN